MTTDTKNNFFLFGGNKSDKYMVKAYMYKNQSAHWGNIVHYCMDSKRSYLSHWRLI
jgi:hypothetical protein